KGAINMREEAWHNFAEQGGSETFKPVFESFYKPLYGYGVKLCNQPELVKDCIHDLFQHIWRRRHDLGHVKSLNVYLFVSLRRRIMKEVKERRKMKDDIAEIDESSFITFSLEEIIIRNEVKFQQKEQLQQALNKLPDRQKEVIYLHYYNGLTYGEIEE